MLDVTTYSDVEMNKLHFAKEKKTQGLFLFLFKSCFVVTWMILDLIKEPEDVGCVQKIYIVINKTTLFI